MASHPLHPSESATDIYIYIYIPIVIHVPEIFNAVSDISCSSHHQRFSFSYWQYKTTQWFHFKMGPFKNNFAVHAEYRNKKLCIVKRNLFVAQRFLWTSQFNLLKQTTCFLSSAGTFTQNKKAGSILLHVDRALIEVCKQN